MLPQARRLAFVLLLAAGAPALAVVAPATPEAGGPLPDWDIRGAKLDLEATPTEEQKLALEALRARMPSDACEPIVRWGSVSGTLHHLFARWGTLTEVPSGAWTAESVARSFVARHRQLFGLSEQGVKALATRRVIADPVSGATHACLAQRADGLDVFLAELRVHVDRQGRVVSVAGNTAREEILSRETVLDASAALVAAARSVRVEIATAPARSIEAGGAPGSVIRFERGPFESAPWAREAWFPRDEGLVRAWVVTVDPAGDAGWYQVVVDARTGEPLSRHDLVDNAATEGLVFREDPGQGPQLSIPFVDDAVLTDRASPEGWSPRGETEGNACEVKDDLDADNENTPGRRAIATPANPIAFDFPFNDDPARDLDGSMTNLFYLNSWLHDRYARMGFDEANGNFQEINYSGIGLGGDRVRVDAQDGRARNNADFGTPPDGNPPRMQMYVWTYTSPNRDSGFDSSVVAHELTHGVSNRLVGLVPNDAGCLGGPQGGAMGEAWSDFFACSFWNQVTVGGYLVDDYARGIRRAPYDDYPFGYGDLCNWGGFEPHRDGEIWAATLWGIREMFVAKYGYQRGRCAVERLVLDGMKLSPCRPNFVDMRDAILLAARLNGADGDECLLWEGFAARGLGVGAVPQPDCTSPADASSVIPSECATCSTFERPTSVAADLSIPNEVLVSFRPAVGADTHLLLRSRAPCPGDCLDAEYVEVARGPGSATFLLDVDAPGNRLSVGDRLSYRVVALQGACTSSSDCLDASITGRCTLEPTSVGAPLGVTSLARPPSSSCTMIVSWSAAVAACGSASGVRYNVYRSPDPLFSPAPDTLIASVPEPARSYTDAALPPGSVTYVVRAEDMTTGGQGPHGGNEEGNDARLTLAPQGLPSGTASFSDDMELGELPGYRRTGSFTPNDWAVVSDANTRGGQAWHSADVEGGSADKNLHLPPLTLGAAPRLRFAHVFDFEPDFDGGVIEISTDGGVTWRDLKDDIRAGGYTGRSPTVDSLMNPPNTENLWTGQNPSGFPSYDAVDVDLAPYAGTLDAQLRFRNLVDPLAAQPGGWYVDDILVDDIVTFDGCTDACTSPPVPMLPDVVACTDARFPVRVGLDASASVFGASGMSPDAPYVFTHDGPGSFAGRSWAFGPRAVLTFPLGTPPGDYPVRLVVRGGDTCAVETIATVTLTTPGPLPTPVGDTLRIVRARPGITLSWTDVGAPAYNVHVLPLGADLSAPYATLPFTTIAGSPTTLATGAALDGGGTIFLQVYSASDCGSSVP
jgi:hypothetical protein